MTEPTFLIVGAPKAGTTSLARYLNEHPDVFVSNYAGKAKEPHYFSYAGEAQPDWAVKTWDAYLDLFSEAERVQARGEKSTWYLYSETAAEQIHRTLPDVKILIMLRNPVDRAYSSWSYRVQMGWETESFEDAIREEAARRERGALWDVHYLNAGRYADQVERFLDRFDREQIKMMLFEDLREDSASIVEEALRFVGVDASLSSVDTETVHNATAFPKWAGLRHLLNQGSVRTLAGLLPESIRRPFSSVLQKANQKPRPRLSAATRETLTRDFRPGVRRLSELVGRDLDAAWFPG